jgi:hypothetical protein
MDSKPAHSKNGIRNRFFCSHDSIQKTGYLKKKELLLRQQASRLLRGGESPTSPPLQGLRNHLPEKPMSIFPLSFDETIKDGKGFANRIFAA